MDILIKGGSIVSPWGQKKADVLVNEGKIVGIGNADHFEKAKRVIDATGKYVMPGGIDSHTHHEQPFQGAVGGDDFYTGSVAAAIGGTTTIVDFAPAAKGESPIEKIKERIALALDRGIVIDFGFHSNLTEAPPRVLEEMKDIIDFGVPTFKLYLTYEKEGVMCDDGTLMAVLEEAAKYNGLVVVHAENSAISEYRTERLIEQGKTAPPYHAMAKPNFVEAECIQRAWFLAKQINCPLLILHMSSHEGVEICRAARQKGEPLYAETCPHYLLLTDEVLNGEDGYLCLVSPPHRKKEDNEALWAGIADSTVNIVSTDHAPFTIKEKQMLLKPVDGKIIPRFDQVANGAPGVEVSVPTLMTGYSLGKLTLEEVVNVNSYMPARIMGMYPQKGLIEVGADADILVMDPDKEVHVKQASDLHMRCDWTPYKGVTFKGWPEVTMVRGNILVEGGKFVGEKGTGKFIKRHIDPKVLASSRW